MKKDRYVPDNCISIKLHWRRTLVQIVFCGSLFAIITLLGASCKSKKEVLKDPDTYYTCSMDPQVVEYNPGKCPICHMTLTLANKNNAENKDEILLSAEQIQLGNVQTDTLRTGTIGDKLVLTATLNFDQTTTTSISSRVSGRVEKLYFKNIGDFVPKDAPLYDIYSEELNNSKQEYLLAADRKKAFENDATIDFDLLLKSAKNKLLLWGMSEAQIAQLLRNKKTSPTTTFYSNTSGYITTLELIEGDYLMDGGTIVKLADLSNLWAEAQMYTSQLSEVDLKGLAVVQLPDLGGREIKGNIKFVNPEINPDTRINLIRVSIPNADKQLKPGMPAYVILKSREHSSLTLPIDAVLRDGRGATVWVKTGAHSFKNKMVQVGLESNDRIEIISGLKTGEVIVISGTYLLQSEYIFKKGANPMEGMKM